MSHLPLPAKGCFYDLNVPYDENQKHMESIVSTMKELGYSVIAFSTYIESGRKESGGKKRKNSPLPSPPQISEDKDLRQLSRVTIELREIDDQLVVRDVTAKGGFDIISVIPKTEKLFLSACTQLNVDIITIDGSEKLPYFFRTHQVRAAIARGVQFEFNYAPMVRDPTVRRITTTLALRLIECCKSKNIIMSSKAMHPLELRGPFDVANLGMLFGIKESIVPHIVSHNCRCAVVHAFTRKTAKGAIFVQKISDKNSSKRLMIDDRGDSVAKIQKLEANVKS